MVNDHGSAIEEIFHKNLYKKVDRFETSKLVVIDINTQREEQPSVSPVHKLVCLPFHEVCEFGFALRDDFVTLLLQKCGTDKNDMMCTLS